MPQFAWQALVQELMAEADVPSQEELAEEIGVCSQTVSRWFKKQPTVIPSAESIGKVAKFAGVSERELRWRWTQHMQNLYEKFDSTTGASEVRESLTTYDELRVVTEARALLQLDLRDVLPEQAPSLHQMRDRMGTLAGLIEPLIAALRSLVASYIAVYQGATDSARRVKPN